MIPINTELDVRLQTPLNSGTAQVEQRVEATTMVNLYREDDLIVPAGSLLVGYVASVEPATRTDRKGKLSLQFTRLTVNQRSYDVRVSVTQAIESEGVKGEIGKIGAAARRSARSSVESSAAPREPLPASWSAAVAYSSLPRARTWTCRRERVLRVRFDSEVPLDLSR